MRTGWHLEYRGAGELHRVEAAVEPAGAGEWLARMETALVCAGDLHTLSGRRQGPCPCILGHETVSVLLESGVGAPDSDIAGSPLHPGRRVVWGVVASCGECDRCRSGLPQKCVVGTKYGHVALGPDTPWTGGFAEYQRLLPGTAILGVPDSVPSGWAAMVACSTATVAAVLRVAGEIRGKRVLVNGGGNLGAQAVLWAVESGASSVVCIEPDPARREGLANLGACCVAPDDWMGGKVGPECGVDIFLELAGHVSDFEAIVGRMAVGGRLVLAGAVFPSAPVGLDMETVVRKCLTVTGMHNYAPRDLIAGMGFMERHWQGLSSVLNLAAPLPLERVDDVLELARSGRFHRVGFSSGT